MDHSRRRRPLRIGRAKPARAYWRKTKAAKTAAARAWRPRRVQGAHTHEPTLGERTLPSPEHAPSRRVSTQSSRSAAQVEKQPLKPPRSAENSSAPRFATVSGYGGYEYDNANADSGGGGFLSQSNRESEGGEKEKKPRDKQTLTPVTIKQLQSAEKGVGDDDGYKIDNAEIHSVRVVACVQTVK